MSDVSPGDHLLQIIVDSYARLTGRALITDTDDDVRSALWRAPAVIVAHGTQIDPVFFYGNQTALDVFEMSFAEFTQLPSRFSAEPIQREERAEFLRRVSRDGFIADYSGIRISATGKRFLIERAVVWNLLDAAGFRHGQAATFTDWTTLD